MGYACPVCEEPQVDAEHLANHLAFTAMIHGDGHESWLDERVEDWGAMNPETLGPLVAEHAETVDVDAPEPEHDHGTRGSAAIEQRTNLDAMSADDRAVLEEARELTRQMLEDSESE
ncbi:Uncharacterized protein HSRCO_0586 [Halanaeroarchaeum sp. HSR-CO]|uniref:DUF5810 domain-containing protein n=1 Tax=Halanaeroarchaeum sp. HSR-CO TaxID=2866382 RepID=UPI00217F0BB6|nr:DUF5810 domain-containing protein [Halanaeroarchaeum sp. HSR-CO]UWG46881.1 Uncharacterized protein HSRCO_0586 [Halanaeroarchaeum sp. HSR-CO]